MNSTTKKDNMIPSSDFADITTSLIGKKAPNFVARSTKGEITLSDFTGKWVLLFFHPADFTPVCTTEFVSLSKHQDEFDALNVQLLGLSIDSIFSHRNWLEWIRKQFDVTIDFPVIEDVSMEIARAYQMIDSSQTSTATVRSCIFIDPDQTIQTLIHYPMHVGRSIDELLRVQQALINTRDNCLATPANWQPGEGLMDMNPDNFYDGAGDWLEKTIRGTTSSSS
jgi:peroxiredoxin (alkyl hydroperoxide reductase subunit C)